MFKTGISTTETLSTGLTWIRLPTASPSRPSIAFSKRRRTASESARASTISSTSNNTLTFRYGYTRNDLQDQGAGNLSLLTRAFHTLDTDHTVQLTETAVLSTKVINETRLQWYHTLEEQTANTDLPSVTVAGSFNGGGAQVGHSLDTENHYELQNYTTISGGAHTWKFGVRVRAVTINDFSPRTLAEPTASTAAMLPFSTLPATRWRRESPVIKPIPTPPIARFFTSIQVYQRTLQLQQMGLGAAAIQQLGAGPSQFTISRGLSLVNLNQVDLGAFVGDDWRVKPNLTLSLGLRFETQTNIHDWHDWAPRIGFAWAPGQSKNNPRPKTVLRGGFGIFYDRVSEQDVEMADRYNGILQQPVCGDSERCQSHPV